MPKGRSGRLVPVKKLVSPPGVTPHLRTYYVNPDKDKKGLGATFGKAAEALSGLSRKDLKEYGFHNAKDENELRSLVKKAIEKESGRLIDYDPNDLFKASYLFAAGVLSGVDAATLKKLTTRFKSNLYDRTTEAFGIYGDDVALRSTGPHTARWYQLAAVYAVMRKMGLSREDALRVHGMLMMPHIAPEGVDVRGFAQAAKSGELARGILLNHLSYTQAHKKIGVPVIADLLAGHFEGKNLASGTPFQRGLGHLYTVTQLILRKVGKKLRNKVFYRGMTVIHHGPSPFKMKSGRTQSITDKKDVAAFFSGLLPEDLTEDSFKSPEGIVELPKGYHKTFDEITVHYNKAEQGMVLRLKGLKDPRRILFSMNEHTMPYYSKAYGLTDLAKRMVEEERETLFFA